MTLPVYVAHQQRWLGFRLSVVGSPVPLHSLLSIVDRPDVPPHHARTLTLGYVAAGRLMMLCWHPTPDERMKAEAICASLSSALAESEPGAAPLGDLTDLQTMYAGLGAAASRVRSTYHMHIIICLCIH